MKKMLRSQKTKLIVSCAIMTASVMSSPMPACGEGHAVGKSHSKVMIDAELLAAFVNKPCENFQSARTAFLAGNHQKCAEYLRTASAFMRLESARADDASRLAIEKSIGELERLASAVEKGEVQLYSDLQKAFVAAHLALSSHHCVQSSHCCCQLEKGDQEGDVACVCRELNAATIHLEQATMWKNGKLDAESQRTIQAAHRAAEQWMTGDDWSSQQPKAENRKRMLSGMRQRISTLHQKLESLTGRSIQIARPSDIDVFREIGLR